ncbi:hypothetical protein GQ457_13G024070 [Hibiscus cannabinus]
MLAGGFWFRIDLKLFRVVSVENQVGYRFGRFERGIGSSGKVKTDFSVLLESVPIISFVEARRQGDQKLDFCSSPETFREGSETFSLMVPKPCPKVSKPWTEFFVRTERFRNLEPRSAPGEIRVTFSGLALHSGLVTTELETVKKALQIFIDADCFDHNKLVVELGSRKVLNWIENPLQCPLHWWKDLAEIDVLVH